MTTPRRRTIRLYTEPPQPDPVSQRRQQKLRARLFAQQAALERWWKRLCRACNAIEKHQRALKSLNRQLNKQEEHANGQDH
jgi:hypothetical protein